MRLMIREAKACGQEIIPPGSFDAELDAGASDVPAGWPTMNQQ